MLLSTSVFAGNLQGQAQGQIQGQAQANIVNSGNSRTYNNNSSRTYNNNSVRTRSNDSNSNSTSRGGSATGGNSHSTSRGGSASSSTAQTGNTTSVTDNSVYEASHIPNNTPNVSAPSLSASNITCLGGASGGVSFPGFGISGGSTTMDKECNVRQTSIRFSQLGMTKAAVRAMCQSPVAKVTLKDIGYDCGSKYNKMPTPPTTTFTSSSNIGGFLGQ